MISIETYYLRGNSSSSVYSDTMYNYERTTGSIYSGRKGSWNGKIALPYPSDYGYAADFNYCTQALNNYNDSTCISNNWMKSILGTTNNSWLLTARSNYTNLAWMVYSSGSAGSSGSYNAYGITPVLYLNSVLEVQPSTTGTSTNPYKLVV